MWQPMNETYFVIPDEVKVSNLIPEHLKDNMVELRTGKVIAVGTGTLLESGYRQPLQAKIGDRVLYGAKVGRDIDVDGKKVLLLAEANVLGIERANQEPVKTTFTLQEES